MTIQVIVYSLATGRHRATVDPTLGPNPFIPPNAIAYLNQVPIHAGEGRIVYNKKGGGQDDINAWQAAINAVTGKSVVFGQDAGDTYAEVDAGNNILAVHCCDPACGDLAPNGGTLVRAPAGCSMNWTYDGVTFSPPVFPVPVKL